MKQKIFLFLALALLLFIAGCTQQNLSAEDSISADENLIKIGVSQIGAESDWRVANSESIKTVFTEAGGYHLLCELIILALCPFRKLAGILSFWKRNKPIFQ